MYPKFKGYKVVDFKNEYSFRQNQKAKEILKEVFKFNAGGNELEVLMGLGVEAEIKLLALLYTPIGKKWSLEVYEQNLEYFADQPQQDTTELVKDFFTLKGKSIIESSLTYLTALGSLQSPQKG